MVSFVPCFGGSPPIQSRYVRTTDDSAESGCIPSRRRSCFSASFSTSGGIPAALTFSRSSSISSDLPSMSPSSVLMAFICSRRKYSRWLLVISSLAWFWIFACISASWSSRERRLLTGEFWAMTTEGDGNYMLQRWLESEGAEVVTEPVSNWVSFIFWEHAERAKERRKVKKGAYKTILGLKAASLLFHYYYTSYRSALNFRPDALSSQA